MTHSPGNVHTKNGNIIAPDSGFDFVIATTIAHAPNDDDGFGNADHLALCWNAHDDLLHALEASDGLICKAQSILTNYLIPDNTQEADKTISLLLGLLDCAGQHIIQENTKAAIKAAKVKS